MLAVRRPACAVTIALARYNASRRANSSLATSSTPLPDDTPSAATQHRSDHVGQSTSRRTIYIRPWEGIRSMAEGFAIIRAFEMRYGKLRDIRFGRDYELNEMYQPAVFANFSNDKDFDAIPHRDTNIKLEIPDVAAQSPGSVSLADLQGLLVAREMHIPVNSDPSSRPSVEFDSPRPEGATPPLKTVDVIVGRSIKTRLDFTYFMSDPEPRPNQNIMRAIGRGFVQWGGFYEPKPPTKIKRPLLPGEEESDLEDVGPLPIRPPPSTKRMHAAKLRWGGAAPRARRQSVDEDQQSNAIPADTALVQSEHEHEREQNETTTPIPAEESASHQSEGALSFADAKMEDVSETETATAESSNPARLSKRDKLLALARVQAASKAQLEAEERGRLAAIAHGHSHKPLPEAVIPRDPEEERKAVAAERKKKAAEEAEMKATVMGRLRKLWGGW